ncbi:MAG: hypothetical protein JW787_02760 [Sedimentisphaerales bacterium]|nr:hypothetical protein [Sedimentisphaerales bacterium]
MYLPLEIPNARVLVTVKTYPNPSVKYDELVCSAGFLESGEWIRIYPIKFRSLPYDQQYKKYNWIELDLVKRKDDIRQESYRPRLGIDQEIKIAGEIDTGKNRDWSERKNYALKEVFTSMADLISLAKTRDVWKSLATIKPKEFVRFEFQEDEREWKPKIKEGLRQLGLFDRSRDKKNRELQVIRKLPYRYYYHFLTDGDSTPRRLMIEDWEIGALYWNCLAQTEGDEFAANELVRQKYETQFFERDLYLFVGTIKANHIKAPNPFVIIGVFYPPKDQGTQLTLNL